jgi:hypothetical protein
MLIMFDMDMRRVESSRLGIERKADGIAMRKKNIVAKSKELKTGRHICQNLLGKAKKRWSYLHSLIRLYGVVLN